MIRTDSHMHTAFSSDSDTPMEEMIKKSIDLGLTSICFTDHYDMDFPTDMYDDMDFQLDTPSYLKEFIRLKEIYQKKIDLRIGVELGLGPDLASKIEAYLEEYNDVFDFVIGSTHLVDKKDPYLPDYFNQFSEEKDGIRRYFEENIYNLTNFHQMDSFGHCDYVVRYAPNKDDFYLPSDYQDLLDTFLNMLIDKGVALELNTAGWKYGMKSANPHIDILRRYRELGGELLTVGADGHIPAHIAYDFKKASEMLTSLGFSYYTIYRNRKPEMIRINE